MSGRLSDQHTLEVANLAAINDRTRYAFDQSALNWIEQGPFWDTLAAKGVTLAVSREYEHFILLLSAQNGWPRQSPLPLPHPSGMAFDAQTQTLLVTSTRTPNILFWLQALSDKDWSREIVPADIVRPDGTLFLPRKSQLLPGSLYIHEIVKRGADIMATVTGHNFVARLDDNGWTRLWWPAALDRLGNDAFRTNFFQLNGMAAGPSLDTSFFTAFSDLAEGVKPWKQGYGPCGKGVIFSGQTRDAICRDLTCPHSPRLRDEQLWVCNSGHGTLSRVEGYRALSPASARSETVARLPGFTRGLAFLDNLAFVGLSRVIPAYEAYAPGVAAAESVCGISIVDLRTGQTMASLVWPTGYQIFDIQLLPGISSGCLPFDAESSGEVNSHLRFLG
jgi:uncharacterized protein (TIGR03032 family)